ncbi:MAG: hypothetical protein SYNGOMJ08_00052 [Candidatus Syntrophoarchaeum sp. GoM_oil]|nr:MAG: hypothetical protein SYNGOMJ08_00052 [Candidatus Syntrophoarchaeum sp. GoM_oil]
MSKSVCDMCGVEVTEIYELRDLKLCEDCYMDAVIEDQPKQCKMKKR